MRKMRNAGDFGSAQFVRLCGFCGQAGAGGPARIAPHRMKLHRCAPSAWNKPCRA